MQIDTTPAVEATVTVTMTVSEAEKVADLLLNCSDWRVTQEGVIQRLRRAVLDGTRAARGR